MIPEDVNCDGKADVILYNSTTGTEYTGLSNGNGSFTYTFSFWGTGKVLTDQNVFPPVAPSAALSSLVLKPTTVVGGQMVQGMVTLDAPASSPFDVSVSSANPGAGGCTVHRLRRLLDRRARSSRFGRAR